MKSRFFRSGRVAIACSALALVAMATPAASAAPSSSSTTPATGVNMSGAPYWSGQDIVRGVALTHPKTPGTQPGGYVVDAWGAIHQFGGAPAMVSTHYTFGQKTTHSMALQGDDLAGVTMNSSAKTWVFPKGSTAPNVQPCDNSSQFGVPTRGISYDPTANSQGVTVDAWGGIHPFCTTAQPNTANAPYWPNWQIVYGVALLPGGIGGFTLDGWGGVHAWGKAQIVTPSDTYWGPRAGVKAWNIARGVAIDNTGTTTQEGNGIVVDGWGGLHPFTYILLP